MFFKIVANLITHPSAFLGRKQLCCCRLELILQVLQPRRPRADQSIRVEDGLLAEELKLTKPLIQGDVLPFHRL